MRNFIIVIAGVLWFSATSMANESAVALQDAFLAGLVANDAQAMADCYAPDAIHFPASALVGYGPDSVAESWFGFFSTFKVVAATVSDRHLETHGDTAIAWGLFKIVVEPIEGGEAVEMVGRYMDVARNFDGNWLYVADHASIPASQ
jgi:ketosteroid isomerase-like protein